MRAVFFLLLFILSQQGRAQHSKKMFQAPVGQATNTMGNLSFMKLNVLKMGFTKSKSITAKEIKVYSANPDYSKTVYAYRDSAQRSYAIAIVAWDKSTVTSLVDSGEAKRRSWDFEKLSALQWNHPDTIVVKLSYDQGFYTVLKLNPATRTIYTVTEGSATEDVRVIEANEGMLSALKVIFSKYSEDALEQMYLSTGHNLGGGLYVGQLNAKGIRYDIRLFDLNKKSEKVLLSIVQNKEYRNGLKGAVLVGDKIVLALNSQNRKAFMLQVDKNTLEAKNIMTLESDIIKAFKVFMESDTSYYLALQLEDHPVKLYYGVAGVFYEVALNERAIDFQMQTDKSLAVFSKREAGQYKLIKARFKLKMN